MKYHYYRVWQGDSNDRREVTNYWYDKSGLWKHTNIDNAVKRALAMYPGFEDSNQGDDKIAILDYIVTDADCRECKQINGIDEESECDCNECPFSAYIEIEEID